MEYVSAINSNIQFGSSHETFVLGKVHNFDWLNPVTSKMLYSIQKLQTDLRSVETAPLARADFEIKVKRIAHSIVHFDQWNKLISKM